MYANMNKVLTIYFQIIFMIKDITFLDQIVITDVIFFHEKQSFIDFWLFSHLVLHLFLWFLYFDEVHWMNISLENEKYTLFSNELKSKNSEEILYSFL